MKRLFCLLLALVFCLALLPAAVLAEDGGPMVAYVEDIGDSAAVTKVVEEPLSVTEVIEEPAGAEIPVIVGQDPSAPEITSGEVTIFIQPEDVTCGILEEALFAVEAVGASPLSYQWQMALTEDRFINLPAARNRILTVPYTNPLFDGLRFRCVVTDGEGNSAASETAVLTIAVERPDIPDVPDVPDIPDIPDIPFPAPVILCQPDEYCYCAPGESAAFSVMALGNDVRYQWQLSASGDPADFLNVLNANGSNFVLEDVSEGMDGALVRCVLTDARGNTVESSASCIVIVTEPEVVWIDSEDMTAMVRNADGLYIRVSTVVSLAGQTGLYVSQGRAVDGVVELPTLGIPGLVINAVSVALVPTLEDIQSPTPTVMAALSMSFDAPSFPEFDPAELIEYIKELAPEQVKELLDRMSPEQIWEFLENLDPAAIAVLIPYLDPGIVRTWISEQTPEQAKLLFSNLSPDLVRDLLHDLIGN